MSSASKAEACLCFLSGTSPVWVQDVTAASDMEDGDLIADYLNLKMSGRAHSLCL